MNRFVRAAGVGALVFVGFEVVAVLGNAAWNFFVADVECPVCGGLDTLPVRCPRCRRDPSPVDPEATPKVI